MVRLGVLQSGYLPWLGFFDQINRCDLFIIYDDLQYTKRDWRNRNRIKTSQGIFWLTVPIRAKGAIKKRISQIEICYQQDWPRKHWKALKMNYARAPFFHQYSSFFCELYKKRYTYLSQLNRAIIEYCLKQLGITTPVIYSYEIGIEDEYLKQCKGKIDPTERIIYLCKYFGAHTFLEGSAGRNYINKALLKRAGIKLEYQDYIHPTYPQLFGPFVPYLSVIDLMFNCGEESLKILSMR